METQWPLVAFTLLAGSGAGVLAFSGISEFFDIQKRTRSAALIAALVLLVAGGIASVFHLGHPANVMSAAGRLFSGSPISLELLFLGLAVVVAAVYLVVARRGGKALKGIGVAAVIVSLALAYACGHGYEVIGSRPGWATPALGFAYCASGLTVGGFLFLALTVALKEDAAAVRKLAAVAAAVAAVETVAFVAYGLSVPLGENALLFWGGAVIVGGIVAVLAGSALFARQSLGALSYVGLAAALVGGVCFRVLMWALGSPAFPNAFDLANNARGLFPF
jgi:anaerobic dimethyl sulfoxide reductase subunit C (anchor subunit)